jgi:hypothetical protein
MNAFVTELIAIATIAMAAGMPAEQAQAATEVGLTNTTNVLNPEVADRDKRGTSTTSKNANGPQMAKNKPNASRGSFEAEGMGFEPTTAFAAPHFQCGCWPIRLPSGGAGSGFDPRVTLSCSSY